MVHNAVDDILQEYEKKPKCKNQYKQHENIDSDIGKKSLYGLDKSSLDDIRKEGRKRAFES